MSKLLVAILLTIATANSFADELRAGGGVFAASLPSYPGAKHKEEHILPFPYFYYRSDDLKVDREGLIGYLWNTDNVYLDYSMAAAIPVDSEEVAIRKGMPDIDWRFEAGPSINYYWQGDPKAIKKTVVGAYSRVVLSTDFSDISGKGLRSGIQFLHQQPAFNDNFIWQTKVDVRYTNSNLLNYVYGISEQYTNEQRVTFQAEQGYSGTRLSTGFVWQHKKLWLGAFVRADFLNGTEQLESALVQESTSYSAGIGLAWIFYQK